MQWSKFNVIAEKAHEKRCLVYNTFSDSQVLCDDKNILHTFKNKIKNKTPLTDAEEKLCETFVECGFLVDDNTNEKQDFLNWFDEKVRNNYEELSYLLLTSRTCNLRCPYCFEKDVLAKGLNMSMETARQFVEFNNERVLKYKSKKVAITFFGGEPLMNVPVLEYIATETQRFCLKQNTEFEFGIVTNGVMLKREKVKEWIKLGLKWIKITLDGDKHDHDKLRVTQSGKGTFDKIWANLSDLAGIIPFYIGGNFNSQNENSLKQLVDRLNDSPFRNNIFSAEFKPIQAYEQKTEAPVRTDFTGPAFDAHHVEVMMRTRNYIQSKNLPSNDQIGIGPCELHRKSFFGVDMTGKLYKCSAMVGKEQFASGDIWQGADIKKVDERMGTGITPWKDCGDCAFIPVCAGGCKAVGFERYQDFSIGSCDKLYFKQMVQEMFERNLNETIGYEDGLDVTRANLETKTVFNQETSDDYSGDIGMFSV
ncbi:radical SAM protein [bacterium]|nr:radical SAM protein [bacterium]